MKRLLIIDDHQFLAEALADYLDTKPNIQCVGILNNGADAVEKLPDIDPDTVLLDIGLPDMDGISCCKALLRLNPNLKIIGLSSHTEAGVVKNLFKGGAKGFVSKVADLKQIEIAIDQVHRGQPYLDETIQSSYLMDIFGRQDTPKAHPSIYKPDITNREFEVLRLVAEELTTEEIGSKLFISKNTVQTHRKNLISKFGVKSSVGLVIKALEFHML